MTEPTEDAPFWRTLDPVDASLCAACGFISDTGFVADPFEHTSGIFLCADCAEDLVTAYVAASPDLELVRREVADKGVG